MYINIFACFFLFVCFKKALELKPTEKFALVARSRCHLQLGDPESALKDAETSLQEDKEFIRVRKETFKVTSDIVRNTVEVAMPC